MSAIEWQQLAQREHYDRLAAEDRVFELEAEVAELRADKARLDWLSGQYVYISSGGTVGKSPSNWIVDLFETPDAWDGPTIRAAIDAARSHLIA